MAPTTRCYRRINYSRHELSGGTTGCLADSTCLEWHDPRQWGPSERLQQLPSKWVVSVTIVIFHDVTIWIFVIYLAAILSVCLSVCLSPKCKKMRFSQILSNLELRSLLTTYRKSYMGFSKNPLLAPKIQDGGDSPSWILTPKCKNAIFSKTKQFRAMVSIDDLEEVVHRLFK